jgi:hypothetical protein
MEEFTETELVTFLKEIGEKLTSLQVKEKAQIERLIFLIMTNHNKLQSRKPGYLDFVKTVEIKPIETTDHFFYKNVTWLGNHRDEIKNNLPSDIKFSGCYLDIFKMSKNMYGSDMQNRLCESAITITQWSGMIASFIHNHQNEMNLAINDHNLSFVTIKDGRTVVIDTRPDTSSPNQNKWVCLVYGIDQQIFHQFGEVDCFRQKNS